MKRDRFFNGDRSRFTGSGDNGGGRRPPRRPNRMPESEFEPEPEDEKTWTEIERESEVSHFENLGRSMQKGVQIEADKQQAPSAVGYTKEQDMVLAAETADKHVKAVEAMVRSGLEAEQAVALNQKPMPVSVIESKITKGEMVTFGIGAFVLGGIIGFLIGRNIR